MCVASVLKLLFISSHQDNDNSFGTVASSTITHHQRLLSSDTFQSFYSFFFIFTVNMRDLRFGVFFLFLILQIADGTIYAVLSIVLSSCIFHEAVCSRSAQKTNFNIFKIHSILIICLSTVCWVQFADITNGFHRKLLHFIAGSIQRHNKWKKN